MSNWYDTKGNKLVTAEVGTPEWREQMSHVEELLNDRDYKVIKQEYTSNRKYWVSTVWLGLDHDLTGKGKPVIFETMVFGDEDNPYAQARYSTEAQAIKGHERLLKEFERKVE